MYICNSCKSHKIKTRINKRFGKSRAHPVMCKECGSTSIDWQDPKRMRFRKKR